MKRLPVVTLPHSVVRGVLFGAAGFWVACSPADPDTDNLGVPSASSLAPQASSSSAAPGVSASTQSTVGSPSTTVAGTPTMTNGAPSTTAGGAPTMTAGGPTMTGAVPTTEPTTGVMTSATSAMTGAPPGSSSPPVTPLPGEVPVPDPAATPTPDVCTFTQTGAIAPKIATVGVVTWSTTLAGVTEAQIDFGLAASGVSMSAPVDLASPGLRTLLLGMKGDNDYTYRIVAKAGGTTCVSENYMLTTGPVPTAIPLLDISVTSGMESKIQPGFIIMSGGLGGFGGGGGGGGGGGATPVYIIDQDGDPVWWSSEAPNSTSRAKMNWDGSQMWMLELNVENGGSDVKHVEMDGEGAELVPEMNAAHHDFTVLPDGVIGFAAWNSSGMDPHNSLRELSPDGTVKTIVADFTSLYTNGSYHPNAIHYLEWDDSYTISDRNPNLFVKVKRDGTPVWQLGGTSNPPAGKKLALPSGVMQWQVNHGHELTKDGTFLFFNNGSMGGKSTIFAFKIDEAAGTTSSLWSYQSNTSSNVLGDIQALPNGNFLVTYSTSGVMHEIDSAQKLIRSVSGSTMGYAEYRPSLYGKPYRP